MECLFINNLPMSHPEYRGIKMFEKQLLGGQSIKLPHTFLPIDALALSTPGNFLRFQRGNALQTAPKQQDIANL